MRSHDGDEVRVEAEARGRRAEQVRFVLDQSGNDVRFEVRVDGWLTGLFGSLDVRARLWVPRRYSLVLRASGGDVRIDGITGDVSLKTSGGDASRDAHGGADRARRARAEISRSCTSTATCA